MIDVVYVLVTIAFFAAMLAYVAGCDRLGGRADPDGKPEGQS